MKLNRLKIATAGVTIALIFTLSKPLIAQTGVQSQDRIQAYTMLHLYDSAAGLLSETSIVPHAPFGGGSFWMNPCGGARFGLALANSSGINPATVTLEFFGEDGVTPLGTVTLQN